MGLKTELPIGRDKRYGSHMSGAMDRLLGGWQIVGITTLSEGNWFTITDANGDFANSDGRQRPDEIGQPNVPPCVPGTSFNTCAFVDPPLGSFGNTGQKSLGTPQSVS